MLVALAVLVLAAAPAAPHKARAEAPAASGAAEAKKAEAKKEAAKAEQPKPAAAPRSALPTKPARATAAPVRGEVVVAPSIASLGEKWADAMTGGEIGAEADRKAWLPAFAFGARSPLPGALALEVDGSGTRFSAPVPGGRTEGWVAHAAGRVSYDRERWGVEGGVLVRAADLATPATDARVVTVFPSVEVRGTSGGGTQGFLAAWDNPLFSYAEEGWLRAGARHDWGRLSGEVAVGLDPLFAGEDATGPVLESRLEIAAGKGTRLGLAMRAAEEPMAGVVVRRVFR